MNTQQFLSAQLLAVEVRGGVLAAVTSALDAQGVPSDCIAHVRHKVEAVLDEVAITATVTEADTALGAARKAGDLFRPVIDHLLVALVHSLVANWHAEQDDE
jgi:hypothetical protein